MIPKFKKDVVYQKLKDAILAGSYAAGAKLPKELDFARELGVSFITLRAALGRLEEDGLIVRIPSKGTFVREPAAESGTELNGGRRKILLAMPDFDGNPATENLFNRGLILGAVKQGYLDGFDIVNCRFDQLDSVLDDEPVAGIIWDRPGIEEFARIQAGFDRGWLQVTVNRHLDGIPAVGCNYPAAIRQAVRHLRGIGHKYIALIDHAPEHAAVFAERQEAFFDQLRYGGVDDPQRFLIIANRHGNDVILQVSNAMRHLPEVSAVIVSGVFVEAFHLYLQEAQIGVPGELSVIQWGENLKFGQHTDHPYSILTEPRSPVGQRAVELIGAMLDHKRIAEEYQLLDGDLLMRKGCALPRDLKKIVDL